MTTEQVVANYKEDVEEEGEEKQSHLTMRELTFAQLLYETWALMWPSQQLCEVGIHDTHFEDEKT